MFLLLQPCPIGTRIEKRREALTVRICEVQLIINKSIIMTTELSLSASRLRRPETNSFMCGTSQLKRQLAGRLGEVANLRHQHRGLPKFSCRLEATSGALDNFLGLTFTLVGTQCTALLCSVRPCSLPFFCTWLFGRLTNYISH